MLSVTKEIYYSLIRHKYKEHQVYKNEIIEFWTA